MFGFTDLYIGTDALNIAEIEEQDLHSSLGYGEPGVECRLKLTWIQMHAHFPNYSSHQLEEIHDW